MSARASGDQELRDQTISVLTQGGTRQRQAGHALDSVGRQLRLTKKDVDAAVLGGAVLGGGGGGWPEEGRQIGYQAVDLGDPVLKRVDELRQDAVLVTVAAVGAPSAMDRYAKAFHYVRALQLLETGLEEPISGIITNENGPFATVNGWLQSALLGVPAVDAPCNGRAQPTTMMGAMGLHRIPDYVSRAVACGGRPGTDHYLEVHASGSLVQVSTVIREVSTLAGGIVAVARNPVLAPYAAENGAPGAVGRAMELGRAMLEEESAGPEAMIEAAANTLGADVICRGEVVEVALSSEGGFDRGSALVRSDKADYELTFWNEYMTLESSGRRLATFPELIATLGLEKGVPISSADLTKGQRVALLRAGKDRLILGAGMRDPELFRVIEEVLDKEIVRHVFLEEGE